MGISVTFTDHADGTGFTGTVAANPDVPDVATFYVLQLGTSTWIPSGSINGVGSLSIPIPNMGAYWGFVYWISGGVIQAPSTPTKFRVTDGTQAVMWRCLLSVQEDIESLAVFPTVSVIVQSVPYDRYMGSGTGKVYPFPCVIISPGVAETMNRKDGTNYRDDVGYPVRIDIVDNDNHANGTDISDHLLARERIARYFRNQALSSVTEIYNCEAIPGPISDHTAFDKNLFVSTLTLRFISREIRGTY